MYRKMYHWTNKDNMENIMKYGLLINPPYHNILSKTDVIYLSDKPLKYTRKTMDLLLEINVTGLHLIKEWTVNGISCYISTKNIEPDRIKIKKYRGD